MPANAEPASASPISALFWAATNFIASPPANHKHITLTMYSDARILRRCFAVQAHHVPVPHPTDNDASAMSSVVGTFYEFFSGAGMVRAGLGNRWRCLFANDIDPKKAASYRRNWGGNSLHCGDIADISAADLPGYADLAWASFPCQDLSLAGNGAGLGGERSGTFWPFWKLMLKLGRESKAPSLIILENVCGTLTSHGGRDFQTICHALRDGGYLVGALVVDAALFVPQSRPRLLIIAVRDNLALPESLVGGIPNGTFLTRSLTTAFSRLPTTLKDAWIWWGLPTPPVCKIKLSDVIEDDPQDAPWDDQEKTQDLLDTMSQRNRAKVRTAQKIGRRVVGTVYKRTRRDDLGEKMTRAEVRFDEVAGCLRTPAGGSSRQVILVIEGESIRSRLISSRETARLMGLPDEYLLPENYNEAYHLTGDGVVVQVVSFLGTHIAEPIIAHDKNARQAA